MIRKFLSERRSWILLFLSLQALTLFIVFVDSSIPLGPVLYLVFMSIILFIGFLIFRYRKESRFYKSLDALENDLDITNLTSPTSPFEKIIAERLSEQTTVLTEIINENQLSLEQEKEELLAWIHEIKTPLTAMNLMIERMEDKKLKAQLSYEWLRVHLLVDRQLHQKRLPFMENDLYIERIDLKSLLFTEIKAIQSWCMQKGIGLDVDLQEKEVLSDGKWLAFIIRQLLTNAVKYSPPSSDIIVRSFLHETKVKLTIQDFGRGINSRDLPRIFDKGFTSYTDHQDRAATGMGLYLAKKTAKPLRIGMEVSSQFGEGTVFTLTFPKENEFVHIAGV